MKIRKAKLSDIPRIAELGVEYGKYEHKLDKNQKIGSLKEEKRLATLFFKNKEVEWFLLDNGGKVLGFSAVSVDKRGRTKRGVLHTIFIEKDARGKGEGTKLLHHALNYLKKKGCISVKSKIFSKNKVSLRLHKRLGFKAEKNTGYSISKKLA